MEPLRPTGPCWVVHPPLQHWRCRLLRHCRRHRLPRCASRPRLLLVQAFQWSRPIPTSLKIIHSRVYAQAITLAALGAVAGVEMYAASDANIKPASRHGDY